MSMYASLIAGNDIMLIKDVGKDLGKMIEEILSVDIDGKRGKDITEERVRASLKRVLELKKEL